MAMDTTKPAKERPLSPHLQIYKPQMTSMLSILHRLTGVTLAFGLFLVAAVLISAAMGEEQYNTVMGYVGSPVGMIALAGWSFAMIYHTMNGIRHLIWDTGRMLDIKSATAAGYVVFWGAVLLTGALWFCVLTQAGDDNVDDVSISAQYDQEGIE